MPRDKFWNLPCVTVHMQAHETVYVKYAHIKHIIVVNAIDHHQLPKRKIVPDAGWMQTMLCTYVLNALIYVREIPLKQGDHFTTFLIIVGLIIAISIIYTGIIS